MDGKIISNTINFFKQEEEEKDYYKPKKQINFIAIKTKEKNKNKTLLIEQYLNRIRPCLKDIKSD